MGRDCEAGLPLPQHPTALWLTVSLAASHLREGIIHLEERGEIH